MAISLQQLEDDWLNYKPAGQRPLGGRRALMGFDYQISLSLNSFFDKVLKNDKKAVMAFEGLSDLSELRKGIVYLTQVKATLTQERFKESIREFLAVDSFLEDMHKDIRSKVRYQISCKAIKGTVRQDLSANELGLTLKEAGKWAKIRWQLLPYVIQGDPSLELAIKLWNRVSKPFDFIAASRGVVLQSLAANESSDKICERLLESWQYEQTTDPPPGQLLTPSLFQDLSEGQTHILVGQRPSIEDLNSGCFMEREELVRRVLDGFNSATSYDSAVMTSRKLPVVWISGGSGVGKSALLLQTVRRLVVERDTPVNYLRHFPDQLPKSLTYWGRQGIPSLIAIDDLYAPDYRDATLWSNVSRLAYEAPYVTILTCGPSDYREAFEQYSRAQGAMSVVPVEIPALSGPDRETYREWYGVRTCQEDVKPIIETNFVIAAFLLERRRKGDADINEFAARLWQRLTLHGLTEEFLASLAVNRLGIEAPMSLFHGKPDAISQLVDEGLVQLVESPDEEAHVLWFHPALARKIYDILTPPGKVETRAAHLARYFSVTFADNNRAIALLQLLGNEKQNRVRGDLVKESLKKIGDVLKQKHPPDLNISYLFKYKDAVLKAGLSFERILPPSLLRGWMVSPVMNSEGWGLLWQLVWEYSSQEDREKLTGEAVGWLKTNMHSEGGWTYVWLKLWAYKTKDEHLKELARQWVVEHTESRGWGYVFQQLYEANVREDWLLQNGIAGLLNSPVSVADRYLWPAVESLGPAPNAFLCTLTRRLCNSTIPHITKLGVNHIVNRISQVGIEPFMEGLNQNMDGLGWPYVFGGVINLLKSLPHDHKYKLISQAKEWLIGREDRPEWSHVWRWLLELAPDDNSLVEPGRRWLIGHKDRPDWSHVWERLLDRFPSDSALIELGWAWLDDHKNVPDWAFVWRYLLKYSPDDEQLLLNEGRRWLIGREDWPEWAFVWQRLLDYFPSNNELLKLGEEWLAGREDKPEWNYVWQRLLDYFPGNNELLKLGEEWLAGREDKPEWNYVWQRLLDYFPGDDDLLKLGEEWLVGRESRPGYPFVVRRLRWES